MCQFRLDKSQEMLRKNTLIFCVGAILLNNFTGTSGSLFDDFSLFNSEESSNSIENDDITMSTLENPCKNVMCSAGRECHVSSDSGEAKCRCVQDCGTETDPRRKVCSNNNETFSSDCELHRMRCHCEEGNFEVCTNQDKYMHSHVQYYGECRSIPECDGDDLEDFPRRMRDWLFNVMSELADRSELSYYYQKMRKEAEANLASRWSNAAVWKWCSLDADHDSAVSRHELFPVRAPLQTLEHCIGDFLDKCDGNGDHKITLEEWGECLMIPTEEIQMRCESLS